MFGWGTADGDRLPGEVPGILPSRVEATTSGRAAGTRATRSRSPSGRAARRHADPGGDDDLARWPPAACIVRPHLTAGAEPEARQLELNPQTLRTRRGRRCVEAVEQGTGRAALEGIEVAGKTGTAQVYQHSAGVDSDELPKAERDHAWFVGYAPADDPRIAFAVIVEHGGHGGATAAPVARAVLEVFFSERGAGSGSRIGRLAPAG